MKIVASVSFWGVLDDDRLVQCRRPLNHLLRRNVCSVPNQSSYAEGQPRYFYCLVCEEDVVHE